MEYVWHWNCSNSTDEHLFLEEDAIHIICLPGNFQGKKEHLEAKIVFMFEKYQENVNIWMKK